MSTSVETFSIEQSYSQDDKPFISRIEFISVNDDLVISFYDSSLMSGNEYEAINIEVNQLVSLKNWIEYQLNKKAAQ